MAFTGNFASMIRQRMPQQAAPQQQPVQRPNFSALAGGQRPAVPQQQSSALASRFAGLAGRQAPQQSAAAGAAQALRSPFGGGQQPRTQAPAPAGMRGMMGNIFSDERSKERIRELESVNDRYRALLDDDAESPELRAPDTDALDDSYRRAGSYEYSYKDPGAPGAAPGRHVGPMAHEIEGIPGVVSKGPDGMRRVDPGRLTMANTSELGEQRRELDELHAKFAALSDDEDATLDLAAGRRR